MLKYTLCHNRDLLLEHVADELALHGVLDELLLADVAVPLLVHGVPGDIIDHDHTGHTSF